MHKRFPEDAMPFFPVHNDPATWVRAPSTHARAPPKPKPPQNHPPRNHRQQTINQQQQPFDPYGHVPDYTNELFARQAAAIQSMDPNRWPVPMPKANGVYRPPPLQNRPPAQPQAPVAPQPPPFPDELEDDETDRLIMNSDTSRAPRPPRGVSSLPPKPPATFEQSLPDNSQ